MAALSRFGLDQLMDKITLVCDRGSNLIKALDDYQVVHCFPHRLNNVLKRTFCSAGNKERKQRKESLKKNQNDDQFNWNNSNDDDNDCLMYYDDRNSNESESDDDIILDEKSVELALRSLPSSPERDHVNVLEKNLPPYAAQVLATIVCCKQLCCHVNWHPKLEALRKSTIKQAIIVQWLTMSQLLESILSSYSALTSIASVAFFKRRAQQLLKAMFSLHDLHWIAAILNPHTRMLKHATDVERAHAYCL
ncbi:unnamed protein product, partial [Rotaria sp. Silwood1]